MEPTLTATPLTAREFFALALPRAKMLHAARETGLAWTTVQRAGAGHGVERATLDRLEAWSRQNETARARGVYLSAQQTEQALRDAGEWGPRHERSWAVECPAYHARFTSRQPCRLRLANGDPNCVRCSVGMVEAANLHAEPAPGTAAREMHALLVAAGRAEPEPADAARPRVRRGRKP